MGNTVLDKELADSVSKEVDEIKESSANSDTKYEPRAWTRRGDPD